MKSTKSLLGGMTVLGVTGIVCKLIGVLFSIPLTWIIGVRGLGVFQGVFPTYNLLLTVSSAGLPVAVSRMVSHSLARRNPAEARAVFRVALWIMAALGLAATLLMLGMSDSLSRFVHQPESVDGFRVIAPCVFIVCVLAAFRGFMQGQQNMVPTAISQLIEQVGKVVISLPLAYLGNRTSAAMGAAGALLGITVVEAIATLFVIILYFRQRGAFRALPQEAVPAARDGALAGQLMAISIPITISACIVPLAQFVDSAMLVQRMGAAGIPAGEAQELYGLFSGLVIRLINIPTALALAISMSLVPAISAAYAVEDGERLRGQTRLGIRFAFLVGFPCAVGMSLLSRNIISFFYQETLTSAHLQTASELLSVSSLTVVLFTVVQATSAILQGIHRQRIPMYTLCVGVGLKILMNYILVGIPGLHIHGGPIASIVCYSASMIPNLVCICRAEKLPFDWKGWVLRPGLATLCMTAVVLGLRAVLPVHRLITIAEVGAGAGVYLLAALKLGAVTREDLRAFRRRG